MVTKLKKIWPTPKKNCYQALKKTLRESQKAALRVGRFSRCWGDKNKLWQNSKTQIVKKNLKTQKLWQNSKTLIVKKLKNSNRDKTQKLKVKPNTKILNVTKFKTSNWTKKENCDKTQKLKIATKLEISNCDKTKKSKLWQN